MNRKKRKKYGWLTDFHFFRTLSSSCESLESIGSNPEFDPKAKQTTARLAEATSSQSTGSFVKVQEYINALPTSPPTVTETDERMIPLETLEKTGKNDRWARKGKSHGFSYLLSDIISLDNIKPLRNKKLINREKHKRLKIVSSFSMENLIF